MPRIRVNDVHLHYDERGEGEPLLLISGYGASSAGELLGFGEQMARTFRVIVFDNRGTGESDLLDGPTSIAQMADDAAGLLDALGIERVHVMGLSMGGLIAQELALSHSDKVAGLVLRSTCYALRDWVPPAPESLRLTAPEATAGLDPREAARQGWALGFTPEFIATHRDLLEARLDLSLVHPTPAATRTYQMEAARAWSSYARLPQLVAPTLIITGDRDVNVAPENSHRLHERIAGSQLYVVKDAGHGCHVSHPEEVARVVTEFLASCGATT